MRHGLAFRDIKMTAYRCHFSLIWMIGRGLISKAQGRAKNASSFRQGRSYITEVKFLAPMRMRKHHHSPRTAGTSPKQASGMLQR